MIIRVGSSSIMIFFFSFCLYIAASHVERTFFVLVCVCEGGHGGSIDR